MTMTGAGTGGTTLVSRVSLATGSGRSERNQPADSQARGMVNSDQPQSMHTQMSGEGVMGGWLSVRGLLRNSRTSAGTTETALDWHFGQIMHTPQETRKKTGSLKKGIEGEIQCSGVLGKFSTVTN